jgi:hypothetical protein
MFADDKDDAMPGGFYDAANPDPMKHDWIGVDQANGFTNAPEGGTMHQYLGRSPKTLRCPRVSVGTVGGANGSNGKFDYSKFGIFTGARRARIPVSCTIVPGWAASAVVERPTPMFIEQNPSQMNDKPDPEGYFTDADICAATHRGGFFYWAIDGVVHWQHAGASGSLNVDNFFAVVPSGNSQILGRPAVGQLGMFHWGDWHGL